MHHRIRHQQRLPGARTHRLVRLAGMVAVGAAALAGGTAGASAAVEHPHDPLGLIAPGGGNCEAAANAYAMAGWTVIDGNNMANVIVGGNGPDFIRAWGGNDDVDGLGGRDVICLGSGDDRGQGGNGNDSIYGQLGDDREWGELHNDHLDGGAGADLCNGGPGVDTFFSC